MASRRERLQKLVKVQEKLTAFHRMRHATFVAEALAAGREADEIAARFDAPGSLADLFPDLYARRIEAARTRHDRKAEAAEAEAATLARASARTTIVERSFREARREEERAGEDRATLETVERGLARKGDR